VITFVMMSLVLLQPDLGSAVILGLIWFGIMCLVGARRLYIVGLVGLVAVASVFSWFFLLQDYQKDRVLTFVYPESDPLGAGYNTNQAAIAVGSGKFFGRGLGFGSQSQLRFLPEAQTDFVFSVIGEELGFAGAGAVIGLFGFLFWRLLRIIRHANNDFAAVVVSGVTIVFFSQLVINVGANVGLLPVTGVTLPFVSYGGSSLIVNLLMVGMVQSVIEKRY
jgi:rod shape determining protein RodA